MDGQRLIATTDSYNPTTKRYTTTPSYGANGTEYRTESANFTRIISYGTAGNGPAWFKVWTKGGQIIEYGNTTNAAIEAQGTSTIRTWGVNKISDTTGNYITVTYTKDSANGNAYISRIDYTGNANTNPALAPYASVRFSYETRPDTMTAYHAGSLLKTTKRLTNIKTYHGTSVVKDYRLAYELSQVTQRSRLKTVTECDGAGTCLQSKSFSYLPELGSTVGDIKTIATNLYGAFDKASTRVRNVDMNGDGLADVLIGPDSNGKWYVLRNTGSALVDAGAWASNKYANFASASDRIRNVDMNGDGLPDVLIGPDSNGKWYVLRNTGSALVDEGAWVTTGYGIWDGHSDRIRNVDMNGDGLPDVLIGPGSNGTWYVLRNTGSALVDEGIWVTNKYANFASASDRIYNVDMNGDGLSDVLIGPSGSGEWYLLSNVASSLPFLSKVSEPGSEIVVSYNSLVGNNVYTKDSGTNRAVYPAQDIQDALYVVSGVSMSSGVGSLIKTSYQYGGLKGHLLGRGSLGFRWMKETGESSGITVNRPYYSRQSPAPRNNAFHTLLAIGHY
ncbi:Repeat domain-containing protein [Methylobacillus rhizosphaerae]|uniref:Repeat domain-containing protein n=2 Tax=Methylobacillus rhizosphaerae TaxID=551994 RepID=A0A239AJN0_9PROT|nr:Repeat domain-containing protein [Methylobacillus rhizosphaerae]